MGQTLSEMITSKKFLMMVIGLIVWFAGRYGFSVDPSMLYPPLALIVAGIAGQAVADHGKEAAKIDAAAKQDVLGDVGPQLQDAISQMSAWVNAEKAHADQRIAKEQAADKSTSPTSPAKEPS